MTDTNLNLDKQLTLGVEMNDYYFLEYLSPVEEDVKVVVNDVNGKDIYNKDEKDKDEKKNNINENNKDSSAIDKEKTIVGKIKSSADNDVNKQWDADLVIDKLYIGSADVAYSRDFITVHSITAILNCADEVLNLFPNSIKYCKIPINDDDETLIVEYLAKAIKFIDEEINKGVVLVNCYLGKSRSATFVIGYLMSKNKWNFENAFKYLKDKRPIISPMPNFRKQLHDNQDYIFSII